MNCKWKMILKKMGMAVLAVFLFGLCSALLYVTKQASLVQRIPEGDIDEVTNGYIGEETEEKMQAFWTVALFGVDSRNGELGAGSNSDTQIILSIDKESGEIKLASVYRDTFLMIQPEKGGFGKINSAYSVGGPQQQVVALNENLDLVIDDYVSFSWKAAVDGVNMLGGIELEITEPEFRYLNSFITETAERSGVPSCHLKEAGLQHLDGVQTVAYCRLRLMDDDFHRTERQRTVMKLLLDKAKGTDAGTLNRILMTILPQTGTSLDLGDLTDMILNAGKYHITGTTGFPFSYETANLGKTGSCVVADTLVSNVTELHRFLYGDQDYEPSDRVQEIEKDLIKKAVGR